MSTLFNSKRPLKEKETKLHPWQGTIKDEFSNKIRAAHNSINNPNYPEKKESPTSQPASHKNLPKFTIIGNRVTKEFIFCVKLVTHLHKYRKKQFQEPVIRGVTSVEWPLVWNDLKLQYGGVAYCLTSPVAVLIDDKMIGGINELKELLDPKYYYCFHLNYYKESVKQFAQYVKGFCRPTVYMHIAIDNKHIGTLIFMLYGDLVPFTCENFLRLCKETKGGYSGTQIHRIVKDGWIQCGGFGLKDTKFYCENFIVPPDRRGVLCMANAGRHVDCSTQFFVLLQPSPWMEHKYVAFGQLIDGESTLKEIESVETWYQSPTSEIIIERTGILNLDCHDIMINRGAKEYIYGHIEDLVVIQMMFLEELMEKVFLEIELRKKARREPPEVPEVGGEEEKPGEEAEVNETDDDKQPAANLHATERFMRKGGKKNNAENEGSPSASPGQTDKNKSDVNNDFDVDEYEPEEYSYQQASAPPSVVIPPEKPYYIPLTDVPYPGEVDSDYDLKKFLRGDYCLESDLKVTDKPEVPSAFAHRSINCPSEIFRLSLVESPPLSDVSSLDSEEEHELHRYLKLNIDRVSFAGHVLRSIVRRSVKCTSDYHPALLTDEEVRRFRIASSDYKHRESTYKKVSISVPIEEFKPVHKEIKRRQTGFVHPSDLEKIRVFQKECTMDDDHMSQRRVRLDDKAIATPRKIMRRQTTYSEAGLAGTKSLSLTASDLEVKRQSVLTRLLDDTQQNLDDDTLPTLKDFKPASFGAVKENMYLTRSMNLLESSEEKLDHYRRGFSQFSQIDDSCADNLNMQNKAEGKVSLDLLRPIEKDYMQENSMRSIEYTRIRPSITVAEYQEKNKKYLEQIAEKSE